MILSSWMLPTSPPTIKPNALRENLVPNSLDHFGSFHVSDQWRTHSIYLIPWMFIPLFMFLDLNPTQTRLLSILLDWQHPDQLPSPSKAKTNTKLSELWTKENIVGGFSTLYIGSDMMTRRIPGLMLLHYLMPWNSLRSSKILSPCLTKFLSCRGGICKGVIFGMFVKVTCWDIWTLWIATDKRIM